MKKLNGTSMTAVSAGLFSALFFGVLGATLSAHAVDLGQIEKDLGAGGIDGWVHGAVSENDMYVFTYRNPQNFFDSIQMSLVSERPAILKQLASFKRNDKIHIKGSFLKNPSPQKHVDLASVELVKAYDSGYPSAPYEHEAKIPDDLRGKANADFLVHAVGGDGAVLVLEYKDAVVPVFVKNKTLAKSLYRNDLVRVTYKFQDYPGSPTHLQLDETAAEPIQVLERIADLNGKPASIEGALILFPKSPEIIFNVFAVEQILTSGNKRQFTLLNFDADVFKPIREKLQKAWDRYPGEYVNGRNKLVSRRVRVRATGTFNEIDPGQANAQVLLKDASAVEILD